MMIEADGSEKKTMEVSDILVLPPEPQVIGTTPTEDPMKLYGIKREMKED